MRHSPATDVRSTTVSLLKNTPVIFFYALQLETSRISFSQGVDVCV